MNYQTIMKLHKILNTINCIKLQIAVKTFFDNIYKATVIFENT
jgi:hypothetical protein